MRYILKDYQLDASQQVVRHLDAFARMYRDNGTLSSVGLAAITGAGKTVIAASVIEAILKGTGDVPADESAVFLWVSDSEDLNQQSRWRINQAASELDRLMENIDFDFRESKLKRGRVYFLNVQKLVKTSSLARQRYRDISGVSNQLSLPAPDSGEIDLWRVIGDTIADPNTTLYLVIDEAHRGMGKAKSSETERSTIVQTLINGAPATAMASATAPAPIVLGISATIQRFNTVISNSTNRMSLSVQVDPRKVQESGLVKDSIQLHIPAGDDVFESVLLRAATESLMKYDAAWRVYVDQQPNEKHVDPLMVVQVENKISDAKLESYMQIIMDTWRSLGVEAFAHVFGDKKTIKAMATTVTYIEPERIQDTRQIRVVFAKEAISTGWDCPRAEVMVSFRPASDMTHITQLMGRMLRTPLARRIDGDEFMNSAMYILPYFNRKNAERVALTVATGGTGFNEDGTEGKLREVYIDPITLYPAEDNPVDAAWELFETLPSETVPTGSSNTVRILDSLAHEIARDKLVTHPKKTSYHELFLLLDYQYKANKEVVAAEEKDIWEVEAEYLTFRMGLQGLMNNPSGADGSSTYEAKNVTHRADENVIGEAVHSASRSFSASLVKEYVNYTRKHDRRDIDEIEKIDAARVRIAALSRVNKVVDAVMDMAAEIIKDWQNKLYHALKGLSEERRAIYEEIFRRSGSPVAMTLVKPKSWLTQTKYIQEDESGKRVGEPTPLPTYDRHMMVDDEGKYPARFNKLERIVVEVESERDTFISWFRNAGDAKASLSIAYRDSIDKWARLRPDFIFFEEISGKTRASLVDPHGHHLADALPKIRGLVRFYKANPDAWFRMETVSMFDDVVRGLDITDAKVRERIAEALSAEELYLDDNVSFVYKE